MTTLETAQSVADSEHWQMSSDRRRAIAAAGIGHFVEYYDYIVYGYVASSIAAQFFPSSDPTISLMSAFASFALAYVARPIGGIVFGHYGDRLGRRGVLAVSILMMGGGALLIGVLPSYAAIGAAAPALLLLARMMQGFSTGGENAGAASFLVEYAPARRRGFVTSLQMSSLMLALLAGSALVAVLRTTMGDVAFEDWGWRLPFLIGAGLSLIGLYLRMRLEDTPAFQEMKSSETVARVPLATTLVDHWREVLVCMGFYTSSSVVSYILLVYMPTYSRKEFGLSATEALYSNTIALVLLMLLIPLVGMLSDRIGRKIPLLIFNIALVVVSYPLIAYMAQGGFAHVLAAQLVFAVICSFFFGAGTAAAAELFPTKVRYTGLALGNNLATAIFGGTAPLLAIWLIAETGSSISPAYLLIASGIITLLAVVPMKETSHSALK